MAIPKNIPKDPENADSDYDRRLVELQDSDENIESLLSGGGDIDQLIESGLLDDGEYFTRAEIEQRHAEETRQLEADLAHILYKPKNILGEL